MKYIYARVASHVMLMEIWPLDVPCTLDMYYRISKSIKPYAYSLLHHVCFVKQNDSCITVTRRSGSPLSHHSHFFISGQEHTH